MKKRMIALLLIATMGLSLFTGCGKTTEGETVDLKKIHKADKEITTVLQSSEFQQASQQEKFDIAKETVDQLVEKKLVVADTVTTVEEKGVITFQYVGGGSATIQTTPFQEEVDETTPSVAVEEIESTVREEQVKAEQAGALVVESPEDTPVTRDEAGDWAKQESPVVDVVVSPKQEEAVPEELPEESQGEVPEELERGEFRVCVYNAFEDTEYRTSNYKWLVNAWSKRGLTNVTVDDEVMVEDLLGIKNYSLVSFSMHGTVMNVPGYGVTPVLVLHDDELTSERDKKLDKYLADYSIGRFFSASGNNTYAITPLFFTNNFSANDLAQTIVYSETCCFDGECTRDDECDRPNDYYCPTLRDDFPYALTWAGAPAVMGFHNSVWADYALNGLYYTGAIIYLGETPEMAYITILDELGTTDRINTHGFYPYLLMAGCNITCTIADLYKGPIEEVVEEPAEEPGKEDKADTKKNGRMTVEEQAEYFSWGDEVISSVDPIGLTFDESRVDYSSSDGQWTIWVNSVDEIEEVATDIDSKLRALGYKYMCEVDGFHGECGEDHIQRLVNEATTRCEFGKTDQPHEIAFEGVVYAYLKNDGSYGIWEVYLGGNWEADGYVYYDIFVGNNN